MSTSDEQQRGATSATAPESPAPATGHGPTGRSTGPTGPGGAATPHSLGLDRKSVVDREKEQFGGIKIGSAFFGWLAATGTAVILLALLAAGGTAFGLGSGTSAGKAVSRATDDASTIGLAGGIALLVVVFIAYYCGGYVAGRMARFNGAKQGVAVWLWLVVIAVVLAIVTAVAGAKYNVLSQLNLPRIPVDEGSLTTAGIIAVVLTAVVALVGAVLGGLAGMRFHRKVDRAGLGR